MLARPPVTRVEGGDLVVRTELSAADGAPLPPVEVRTPIAQADLLDPTATPGVPALVALAAALGEDLVIEGPVDRAMAAGASQAMAALVSRRGFPPLTVTADAAYDAPADGDAVGLLFAGDVDSWAALLDLLDAAPRDRVTHLVGVGRDVASTAAEVGLAAISVEVSGEVDGRRDDAILVALSGALVAAGRMRRLVLPAGTGADAVAALSTGRTEVVVTGAGQTRSERVARVAGSPLARRSIRVCEDDGAAANCGRCTPCLVTMAELAVAGDPDPSAGFGARSDPAVVRHLLLDPELGTVLTTIIEGLPPEHEELRRAWSDAWEKSNGVVPRPRWGDDAPPGLAGPSLPQRVAAALRATTGQAVAPAPAPLGWRAGAVPLRPALGLHDEIRALAAANAERPHGWAVIEHHIRDEARDGHQAGLALALAEHHGAGPTYLPGILWAWLEPPVLDADAVRTLLRTARARLWWRADGDLEPLRVLEAVEQGCLPLQVMPDGAARSLAAALPPALAPLVVSEDSLAEQDLGPAAVAALLGPAVDHLLAGSAEHDLLAGAYT